MITSWASFGKWIDPSYLEVQTLIDMNTSFDWSPDTSTFVVRMPTTKHESFAESVSTEIISQLAKAGNQDNDVKVVTDRIKSHGSPTIDLRYYDTKQAEYPKKTPDKSFGPGTNQFPLVVLEVAYSQPQKKLPRIADQYICSSNGNIKVVLGLDIEYNDKSKKATTSIWRPGTSDDGDLITEEVRNDDVRPAYLFSVEIALQKYSKY